LNDWLNKCHFGDCLQVLQSMPDGIVNTCVTSPPYFGLRDYGHAGQIGLEQTPDEFIAKLVMVFREVRRVLRDDGTLWVNMGDSYAGSGRSGNSDAITGQGKDASKFKKPTGDTAREAAVTQRGSRLPAGLHANQVNAGAVGRAWVPAPAGLKQKDLIGVPWMLAFALRADGWYLRQDIIWAKPNPMPESVTDRCTKSHEYIFLLSKSPTYYCDMGAISEVMAEASFSRLAQDVENQQGSLRVPGKTNGPMKAVHGSIEARKQRAAASHKSAPTAERNGIRGSTRNTFARTTKDSAGEHGQKPQFREDREPVAYEGRRNKRSVWTVSTKPYKGAHFATFPTDLIEPCILAGAPAGGVVLDPFFGSGTTGQVAQALGRKFIGIELNINYQALQDERLRQPSLDLEAAA